MKILIEYESSWRNSFLDGNNNEPLPKGGRKFIASGTNINGRSSKPENFIRRNVSLDTVMGILNRVIGDQRKLYQARQSDTYYFREMEQAICFEDQAEMTNEVTYIRNMTGSEDRESFTGAIKGNDPMFTSDYSGELWGVLGLLFEELCCFIVENIEVKAWHGANPLAVADRFASLGKEKPVTNLSIVSDAMQELHKHFPDESYLNRKGEVIPSMLYCSALYLQLERLAKKYDVSTAKTKRGTISGISKRGFTKKDFMNRFTTGEKKKIWGNPYIRKERIKGQGEETFLMCKARGMLTIKIDIDRGKAKELRNMIECAGVSSFYLGKKGLAYVIDIDTREVQH